MCDSLSIVQAVNRSMINEAGFEALLSGSVCLGSGCTYLAITTLGIGILTSLHRGLLGAVIAWCITC